MFLIWSSKNTETCILLHIGQNSLLGQWPRRRAMRRMPRASNDGDIDRAVAFRLRDLDLTDRAILVIRALQDGDGNADIGEVFGNIPGAESRIAPGAVPAVEGVVDVLVPARQLRLQVGCLVSLLDFRNRAHRNILD